MIKICRITEALYENLPSIMFTTFLVIFMLGVLSGYARADLNGSDLLEEPVNTTLDSFYDFWETVTGNAMNFWLIPVIGVTIGLYANTDEILVPCMFMIGSGVLLSSGYIFAGMPGVPYAFLIFTAIGFTGIFLDLYLTHKR